MLTPACERVPRQRPTRSLYGEQSDLGGGSRGGAVRSKLSIFELKFETELGTPMGFQPDAAATRAAAHRNKARVVKISDFSAMEA